MRNIISAILGFLIAALLYSMVASLCGYNPYDFSQMTWVGETLLLVWHVLGVLVGLNFKEENL